jgi:hypothetical protein
LALSVPEGSLPLLPLLRLLRQSLITYLRDTVQNPYLLHPHTKTLSNTKEVDKQTTLIKQRLKRHQSSLLTPIVEALNQLFKGAQVMAALTALLQAQITTL